MTDNIQLEKFIKKNINKLKSKGRTFLGVFASDELPKVSSHNACLIVNYSPSSKTDSGHWCCIMDLNPFGKFKKAYWFDSYGFDADHDDNVLNVKTNFKQYILNNSNGYDYNKYDYQGYGPQENECGEYSACCMIYGPPGEGASIWNKLKSIKNRDQRDSYIKKFIGIRK